MKLEPEMMGEERETRPDSGSKTRSPAIDRMARDRVWCHSVAASAGWATLGPRDGVSSRMFLEI